MLALVEIMWWHWLAFIACVLVFLALDLGLFHRHAHVVKFREALLWTGTWFSLAMLFALGLRPLRGPDEALEFLTGYLIELSLSMDNVFVIALIFGYFQIPARYQHRVLFWGIVGALVMRGFMIGAGVALISWLSWILYVLGLFVLFTGIKMLFVRTEVHPERNSVIRWVRRLYPVSPHLDGQKFLTVWNGRVALTPLALVLVMVETTDLIFALDSIPAIFAVTTKPFIVFTSNVFAILGLRSLYFVLARLIDKFHFFKLSLVVVLAYVGFKMVVSHHLDIPSWISLCVILGVLLLGVIASLIRARLVPV